MIINYGPKGNSSSSGIDFNFGGKFDPIQYLKINFNPENSNDFSDLTIGTIENKYSLYKEDNKWCLFIYSTCDIQFLKEAKKIDIGLVGGGGGGGAIVVALNGNPSAGGGGGAGGERVTQYQQQFTSQIYKFNIGNGGTQKNPGTKTYIADSNEVVKIEALGGLAGLDPVPSIDDENYYDSHYTDSEGNHTYHKRECPNGGIGGNGGSAENAEKTYINSSYGGNGSAGENAYASQGEDGVSLFSSSILSNQEDIIKVGAGGGGGHGHTWYAVEWSTDGRTVDGYAAPYGDGSIYGRGGNGTNHGRPTELVNVSNEGQKGLIILRGY